MALMVYNSLTRKKEEFEPLRTGRVSMYVCGPTVYDHAHLGHAKCYISFDVIVRYLRYSGYKVRYVQNITDVGHLTDDSDEGEDKLIKRAALERVEPMELAETYTRSYFEDMDALNVLRPDISPRASGHICEQIELIKTLIERGHAYEVNGSVYFRVSSFSQYGKLSGRKVEELKEGARVKVNPEKEAPVDFALWKKAREGHILKWPSPWGWGYPGWHVECSAMAMKYLGETTDIHGGGMENIFPHNECEITQSEGSTGSPFVRYWMHNNMVTVDGVKMSKSLGNFLTIKDAFKKYSPQAVRLLILSGHYRSPVEISEEALKGAQSGLERLINASRNIHLSSQGASRKADICEASLSSEDRELFEETESAKERFEKAMDDDFNAPQALSVLFDLSKRANVVTQMERNETRGALLLRVQDRIKLISDVLGLKLEFAGKDDSQNIDRLIDLLVEVRSKMREKKEWELSDKIRDQLSERGVELEDRTEGTTWKHKDNWTAFS